MNSHVEKDSNRTERKQKGIRVSFRKTEAKRIRKRRKTMFQRLKR